MCSFRKSPANPRQAEGTPPAHIPATAVQKAIQEARQMPDTVTLANDNQRPPRRHAMETIATRTMPFALPRIALGTWAIGGWMWGGTDGPNAIRTIRSALERGVTLSDTRPVSGFGGRESLIVRAWAERGMARPAV